MSYKSQIAWALINNQKKFWKMSFEMVELGAKEDGMGNRLMAKSRSPTGTKYQ